MELFFTYVKVNPEWIHIDEMQTDLFSDLFIEKFNEKFKRALMKTEFDYFKTTLSHLVNKNPNVKKFTLNTPELMKETENKKLSSTKLSKYYTQFPPKLGFKKVKTFNKYFLKKIRKEERSKRHNIKIEKEQLLKKIDDYIRRRSQSSYDVGDFFNKYIIRKFSIDYEVFLKKIITCLNKGKDRRLCLRNYLIFLVDKGHINKINLEKFISKLINKFESEEKELKNLIDQTKAENKEEIFNKVSKFNHFGNVRSYRIFIEDIKNFVKIERNKIDPILIWQADRTSIFEDVNRISNLLEGRDNRVRYYRLEISHLIPSSDAKKEGKNNPLKRIKEGAGRAGLFDYLPELKTPHVKFDKDYKFYFTEKGMRIFGPKIARLFSGKNTEINNYYSKPELHWTKVPLSDRNIVYRDEYQVATYKYRKENLIYREITSINGKKDPDYINKVLEEVIKKDKSLKFPKNSKKRIRMFFNNGYAAFGKLEKLLKDNNYEFTSIKSSFNLKDVVWKNQDFQYAILWRKKK